MFSKEQTEQVAKLANIPLSENEVDKLSTVFAETLDYIKVLDELDTAGIEPTFQVTGLTNIFQQTKKPATLSQEEALQNAKDPIDGKFGTKAVFER